jgi:hypothetical protein
MLQVNGLQPAALAINGANATTLLQTSGGKGGNTTGAGKKGGVGASILLAAGNGGNAPGSGTNGVGGNITLLPGSPGTGGVGGATGNVLIAPAGGRVGIGTTTPPAQVTIVGEAGSPSPAIPTVSSILEVTNTYSGGIGNNPAVRVKNNKGTGVEATSIAGWAVRGVSTDSTGVSGESNDGFGVAGRSNTNVGVLGESDSDIGVFGSGGFRGVRGVSASGTGVFGESNGNGVGVSGKSFLGTAVYGEGTNGTGVHGKSTGNFHTGVFGEGYTGVAGTSASNSVLTAGVYGENTGGGYGVKGISPGGIGVRGEGPIGVQGYSTGTGTAIYGINIGGGYAGFFTGRVKVSNNLEISGNELFGNTRRQMINLYNLDYGIGVQNSTLYFRTANTAGYNWYMGGVHNNNQNSPGTAGISLMRINSAGNLTVKGSVTATSFIIASDRAVKSNFAKVNPRMVLNKLAAMPVQTWSYKAEDATVRHMGPMAQDFRAAFNLGTDDKTISTVDTSGVTMAAIQGLYQMTVEQNRELTRKVAALENRLVQLQGAVKQQRRTLRRSRRK